MEKRHSSLFAGTHLDRNRFSKDIARFKPNEVQEGYQEHAYREFQLTELNGSNKEKKRKRRDSVVERFNVFKSSKSLKTSDARANLEDDSVLHRKKVEKQIELDSLFRKKYGIHISGYSVPSPIRNFGELKLRFGCKSHLLHNIYELRFKEPTPIQMQAIPILLSRRECFACAPTGSGKTLAFLIPMLMKIKRRCKGVKGVIICPTRQLAAQTTRECKKVAKGRKFHVRLMTKELSHCGDFAKIPCDILVSTPLRVDYAVHKGKLDLSRVEYLVIDESDKLFELGFVEQIDSIVKACSNPSIVRCLFSATLPDSVEELAHTIMHDAIRVIVGRKNSASTLVKQKILFAGSEGKISRTSFKFCREP